MAAPANYFYPREIAAWWRDRWRTDLKTELGLQDIKVGSLLDFPAPKDLTTAAPSVFCSPMDFTNKLETVDGLIYYTEYKMRVVYLGRIPEVAAGAGPDPETERAKIRRFADSILEHRLMATAPAFSQTNCQVYFATPTMVPLRPEEDKLVASVNAQIVAAAIELIVHALTSIPSP